MTSCMNVVRFLSRVAAEATHLKGYRGLGDIWLRAMVLSLLVVFAGASRAETVTYYYTNQQGTPLATADASGNILTTSDYRPYGSQVLGSPAGGPGYTGHVNDPDSGLVYMQARYYDPVVGRFLSPDPARMRSGNVDQFGRFSYVANNPVYFVDPTGRATVAVGISAGASWLAGGGGQAQLTFSYKSWNPSTWRLGGYLAGAGQAGTQLGVGAAAVVSISDADSAEEMSDQGGDASAGGSVNVGPVSFGYEQSMCSDCKPIRSFSVGAKLTPLPFEVHTGVGVSAGSTFLGSRPVSPTVTVGPVSPSEPPVPVPVPVPSKPADNDDKKVQ